MLKFTRERPEVRKIIAAGVVGAALPAVMLGAARLLDSIGVFSLLCSGGLECIFDYLVASVVVGWAVAWVALLLLRVAWAWLVVIGGSIVAYLIGWTASASATPGFLAISLISATGFAVVAMAPMRHLGRARWIAAAVALATVCAIAAVL
ncbi:hypothetical protein HerbRD11066_59080 [Herbidospora sp. RD11066]